VTVHTDTLQATAEPACHAGTLRRLDLAAPLATDEAWDHLDQAMTALAHRLHARWTEPDAFD
ncbi:MAG TPA: hypothetical protein PKB06_08955, partial [Actinotalea sp.]|nr:hypothetical protein [Actinotalea sp.]